MSLFELLDCIIGLQPAGFSESVTIPHDMICLIERYHAQHRTSRTDVIRLAIRLHYATRAVIA